MDMLSIYVLPIGELTAGIMFFWVMKKNVALDAAQMGSERPIMKWFLPFSKKVQAQPSRMSPRRTSAMIRLRGTWKGPLNVLPLHGGSVGLPSRRR